jgi:lipopolysaccharide/colanic/teichoic acid biosynthesis glycosyltransferase
MAKTTAAEANSKLGFPLEPRRHRVPLLRQEDFRRMLSLERKRSERSGKRLLLMLVDAKGVSTNGGRADFDRVVGGVSSAIRDTDAAGWFETDAIVGVVFTELGRTEATVAMKVIETKIRTEVQQALGVDPAGKLSISFFAYPDNWVGKNPSHGLDPALYPDLFEVVRKRRASLFLKRAMDIAGSSAALICLSPIFLVLAVLVKATSKGPILFRQQRVGQYGVPFMFLKFRSMIASTDAKLHEKYVKDFIVGKASMRRDGNQKVVFKITNDPRVTWIGRFMRRTSLDEIPQFWNVLTGEMSLVGPRPPIPYELEVYGLWHRRRLLEAKPGITGLWQIHGRSRTTFDDMVRLDLQYSRTWTPLLDLRILLRTPRAVLSGDGAY